MGIDGSSIKKRQKQGQNGSQGVNNPSKVKAVAVPTSALSDFLSFGWGKGLAVLAGVLFIGLMITPMLTSMFKVMEGDLEEQAFEQAVGDRVESVRQSFSGLSLEDPNLLQCIKSAALERGNVSSTDTGGIDSFSGLSMLMCVDMKIMSLQGISSLQELTYLNLDYNGIEDIFELQQIPNLQTLSLVDNPIKNISLLKEMANLRKVVLPDLPKTFCYEIHNAVKHMQSNVENIACRGKWTPTINEISNKKVAGRPLTDEEESLLYDYNHNQDFMPK